jgi:hypothetical protein
LGLSQTILNTSMVAAKAIGDRGVAVSPVENGEDDGETGAGAAVEAVAVEARTMTSAIAEDEEIGAPLSKRGTLATTAKPRQKGLWQKKATMMPWTIRNL